MRPETSLFKKAGPARRGQNTNPQSSNPGKDAPLQTFLEFWAKSGRAGDTVPFHSVAHHCLDVAAAGSALLTAFPPPVPVPPGALAALLALHDIGKFTRTFQAKVEELWPQSLGPFIAPPAGYPHDDAGFLLLTEQLAGRLDPLFRDWPSRAAREPLLRAVAGHHGRPPSEARAVLPRAHACPVSISAAGAFIDAALAAIDPPPLPLLDGPQRARLAWFLAGLAVAADWIGSARGWFPPVPAAAHADLAFYWRDVALARAGRALSASGLVPAAVAPATGLAALFPGITPRPLQRWAETVPLPERPALIVIEDATGSGKTEAALLLAHRLMAAGRAHGLYFALPTMATANAMYDRLAGAYGRLFAADARPSLVLAHGRRALNPRFTESILDEASEAGAAPREPADQTAGAQCAAWIADDRRKAFLAEIGVGTIDQALLAVLPTRHAPLRLFGLSGRILIVDEAHAYDAYMFEELRRLLAFHGALGGTAILLSATLTARQRAELSAAFLNDSRPPAAVRPAAAYPLATIASADGIEITACAAAPELRRCVRVERIPDFEDAARTLADAAASGAAVAWIRNAVDDAIEAADKLREPGRDPLLFHARFAMGDRLAIEADVLERFGKTSSPDARRGQVLVATQVVEQSLDLDFDLIVTDLAPTDLVIQRAGRLWRHDRPNRPIKEPRLLLLAPEPIEDPPEDWLGPALRRTGAVYGDHALLWRSARELLGAGKIEAPEGIRPLVEAVYDRDASDAEPAGLRRATDRAKGRWLAARGAAWQNLLELDRPYERRAGLWEPDARTPTRLGDPQVTFRLARLDSGRIVPWCKDKTLGAAWALSEVSVRAGRISAAAPDAEADSLVAEAKKAWPVWDQDVPVLVLRPQGAEIFRGRALGPADAVVEVEYDRRKGLLFQRVGSPKEG
ncbi:MAG: CRISPR-associated helicase Cas3' [Rhodospirillales bacterium]|nr:CRISPR-associated helicase Cas3' [Rhodospirillales bacterium]